MSYAVRSPRVRAFPGLLPAPSVLQPVTVRERAAAGIVLSLPSSRPAPSRLPLGGARAHAPNPCERGARVAREARGPRKCVDGAQGRPGSALRQRRGAARTWARALATSAPRTSWAGRRGHRKGVAVPSASEEQAETAPAAGARAGLPLGCARARRGAARCGQPFLGVSRRHRHQFSCGFAWSGPADEGQTMTRGGHPQATLVHR